MNCLPLVQITTERVLEREKQRMMLIAVAPDMYDNQKKGLLCKSKLDISILDEAHTIRSRWTRSVKAAYHVGAETLRRLTGTVNHKHVKDVSSVLHFVK